MTAARAKSVRVLLDEAKKSTIQQQLSLDLLNFCFICMHFMFKICQTLAVYSQSPIIKNGPIRNDAEILGKFKEQMLSLMLSRSELRNA